MDVVINSEDDDTVIDVDVWDEGISDHLLVRFSLRSVRIKPVGETFSFRDVRRMNHKHFADLISHSKSVLSPPGDVDLLVEQLKQDVGDALDKTAPMNTTTRRVGRHGRNQRSDEALKLKRTRRALERRTKLDDDLCQIPTLLTICSTSHQSQSH